MSALPTFIAKIRNKGLRGCLRIFRERYLYRHWELITLERQFNLPAPKRVAHIQRPVIARIEPCHVPIFERYFSRYRRSIDHLLKQGMHGIACCDAQGHAITMLWVSERDYYDDLLYRCWVRLPPGCIYQFAADVAQPYRRSGGHPILSLMQSNIWESYRQRGFHAIRTLINASNQASLRLLLGLGFKEIGETIHVYCLFGCLHYSRSTPYHLPRLLHLRKNRPARPAPTRQEEPA